LPRFPRRSQASIARKNGFFVVLAGEEIREGRSLGKVKFNRKKKRKLRKDEDGGGNADSNPE